MTIAQWLAHAEEVLGAAGIDSGRLDAQLLVGHVLDKDRAFVLSESHQELSTGDKTELDDLLEKRQQRQPLAYLFGKREFYGLDLAVNKDVLVPRPETETMVEHLKKHAPDRAEVLELGTGSGAIAVALKYLRPDLAVTATDYSKEALKVAKQNAKNLNLDINFKESDLFSDIDHHYDIIAANLPYVPVGARRQPEITFEPDISLYGGDDGLDYYRTFIGQLKDYLKPQAWAIIEASPTQHAELMRICAMEGFTLNPLSEYIFEITL